MFSTPTLLAGSARLLRRVALSLSGRDGHGSEGPATADGRAGKWSKASGETWRQRRERPGAGEQLCRGGIEVCRTAAEHLVLISHLDVSRIPDLYCNLRCLYLHYAVVMRLPSKELPS